MLYQITHCAPLKINSAEAAQARIGREGYILQLYPGKPLLFGYIGEADGQTLHTSPVCCVRKDDLQSLVVATKNSLYRFRAVEETEEPKEVWDEETP